MPRVRAVNHVAIVVHDLARAREFYGRVLGLKELPRSPDVTVPGAWFDCHNTQLHLIVGEERQPEPAQRHLALEVEDFSETVAALEQCGVRIVAPPSKRADGSAVLRCLDTEGNTLELLGR